MRQALLTLAFFSFSLAANLWSAQADDTPAREQRPGAPNQPGLKQAFLGLEIESLPAALSSQLVDVAPKGQGVLVARVPEDSPAAKAGLQPNDILLSYGDQKLYSSEQLIKLVRGEDPGREVTIVFVRAGKPETRKAVNGPLRAIVRKIIMANKVAAVFDEWQADRQNMKE